MTALTRRGLLLGVGAALGVSLAGCAAPGAPRVTMACGESGGNYLLFGTLLRDALLQRNAHLELRQTNGSVENLELLANGDVELAITQGDSVAADPSGFVAIGRVYQNYLQCVTRADSPFHTLGDLAGQMISAGAPRSGAAATTRRVLSASGLGPGPDAPVVTERTLGDAIDALGDGGLAAFFWSGGIPTPQIDRLSARVPVRLLDLTPTLPALRADLPGVYIASSVPTGVYGSGAPTGTVGLPNILVARPELPDDVVGILVDTLVDRASDLIPPGSAGIQYLTAANLIDTGGVPLHPAASQRYRERYG
ncbi:TAXI family TRAP transporter solute-binding subunit [Microbacterium sp. NPDC057659]|uniref:TAXI family TRAP transporter solute-binding subunit n=1 Tax=Microbacterium sp. NPDC057659 TaxID=3346198 RepID=UPI00366CD7B6